MDATNKSNHIEKENKAVEFLNEKLGEDTSEEFKSMKHASALDKEKDKNSMR